MTEQAPEVGGTPPPLACAPRDGRDEGPLVPRPFEGFAPAPAAAPPPRSEVGGVLVSLGLYGVSAFFGFVGFMTVAPTHGRPGAARSVVEARAEREAEIARALREAGGVEYASAGSRVADPDAFSPRPSWVGADAAGWSDGITSKIPGGAAPAEDPRADDDR
ncbi:MAG: hypothetical protein M9894_04825 [Planctomycetes bacterium]|nr:hypothetical protein [Planctomycetota bacterium]